jgi:hypothetical protein
MAPRNKPPRLSGLGQTLGGSQEKPMELLAMEAAAAAHSHSLKKLYKEATDNFQNRIYI